jgi:fructose-1,6-bisphosphatase
MESPKTVAGGAEAKFMLYTDPLDGSANVAANGALGMIFVVYRPTVPIGPCSSNMPAELRATVGAAYSTLKLVNFNAHSDRQGGGSCLIRNINEARKRSR